MKKMLSIALCLVLITSFIPIAFNTTYATPHHSEFNTSKYGDVLDIGTKLRDLQNQEDFKKEAEEKIKKNLEQINFNDMEGSKGDTKYFLDRELDFKTFTLRSEGDHLEVWVADDLSYGYEGESQDIVTQEQVDKLASVFEQTIYPTMTSFFGKPDFHDGTDSPLTDIGELPNKYYNSKNGKVIILVDNIKDKSYYDSSYPFFVSGFYWGIFEKYIDRNIITIDTNSWDNRLEETYYKTLAHEFQHLIHDDNDSMEEEWINEGISSFAEYLCFGTHPMGKVNFYLDNPKNSLVNSENPNSDEIDHEMPGGYGEAYLLQLYLKDHFGEGFIRTLALDKDNGINSINKMLEGFDTGIDFKELYKRFNRAVSIDSKVPGDGIYNFDSIDLNKDTIKGLGHYE